MGRRDLPLFRISWIKDSCYFGFCFLFIDVFGKELVYYSNRSYVKQAKTIHEGVEKICAFVRKELNGDIEVVGDPKVK
jgi:hypothetical protein